MDSLESLSPQMIGQSTGHSHASTLGCSLRYFYAVGSYKTYSADLNKNQVRSRKMVSLSSFLEQLNQVVPLKLENCLNLAMDHLFSHYHCFE